MRELKNYRAGLATRFIFECVNEDCLQKETFYTTKKNKQIFKINRKSVLALRLIGKRHIGLPKLCSTIGLSPPVFDVQLKEHMNFFEIIVLKLRLENIKSVEERAKSLM